MLVSLGALSHSVSSVLKGATQIGQIDQASLNPSAVTHEVSTILRVSLDIATTSNHSSIRTGFLVFRNFSSNNNIPVQTPTKLRRLKAAEVRLSRRGSSQLFSRERSHPKSQALAYRMLVLRDKEEPRLQTRQEAPREDEERVPKPCTSAFTTRRWKS